MNGEWYIGLFQKRIMYPGGTAYFINIDQYDYDCFPKANLSGFLYEVIINTDSNRHNNTQLNLGFNPKNLTISEVESLICDFFKAFGCDYE